MNPAIRQIASAELTERQFVVWESITVYHMSLRAIAYNLDLSRTTVSDHYDAACRKLRANGIHVTPDGTHYLQNGDK